MLSYCRSISLSGINAYDVDIEFDIGQGLPAVVVVGLPDTAVKESKDRVRSAITNSGFTYPERRLTINLAPADTKKEGPIFDLPMALGILSASGVLSAEQLSPYTIVGELSLDGAVRSIRGILPMATDLLRSGRKKFIVPRTNAPEAAFVKGLEVYPVGSLAECVAFLKGEHDIESNKADFSSVFEATSNDDGVDFSDVRGQAHVKQALEISASGGHNLLMLGPPGSGKTMLAKRLPTVIPNMTLEESLSVSKIHSIVHALSKEHGGIVVRRPFRSPHHTISNTGLIGGGSDPKPGEVSLAHNGVLFLDEFPEFKRDVLEVLREPMEEGEVTISRAAGTVTYPADFMLVASMNPCPCGFLGDPKKECQCSPAQTQRYRSKISGPLLDRIDIHVEVPAIQYDEFKSTVPAEDSKTIRSRVKAAREIQRERFKKFSFFTNAGMSHRHLKTFCESDSESERLLKAAFDDLNISARAHDRILKVARTIADLHAEEKIQVTHIAEAINFRALDHHH